VVVSLLDAYGQAGLAAALILVLFFLPLLAGGVLGCLAGSPRPRRGSGQLRRSQGMTASPFIAFAIAFALPFALCFLLARRGHARTAWWLPGGILVMNLLFLAMGIALSGEVQTGFAAAMSLVTLGAPAVVGGALGILLGRPRA
jgi:hypothetical protein